MQTSTSTKTTTTSVPSPLEVAIPIIKPIQPIILDYRYDPNQIQTLKVLHKKISPRLSKADTTSLIIRKSPSSVIKTNHVNNLVLQRNMHYVGKRNSSVPTVDRTKLRALISRLFSIHTLEEKSDKIVQNKLQNIIKQQEQYLDAKRGSLNTASDETEKTMQEFDISVQEELLKRIRISTDLDSKSEFEATTWLALERLQIIKNKTKQMGKDKFINNARLIEYVKTFDNALMLDAYVSFVDATKAEIIDKVHKSDDISSQAKAELTELKQQLEELKRVNSSQLSDLKQQIEQQNLTIKQKSEEVSEFSLKTVELQKIIDDKGYKRDDISEQAKNELVELKQQLKQQKIDNEKYVAGLQQVIESKDLIIKQKSNEISEIGKKTAELQERINQSSQTVQQEAEFKIQVQLTALLQAVERLSDSDKQDFIDKIQTLRGVTSNSEIQSLKSSLDGLRSENTALQEKVTQQEDKLRQVAENLTQTQQINLELNSVKEANNKLVQERKTLNDQINALTESNKTLNETNDTNSTKINTLTNQIRILEQKLDDDKIEKESFEKSKQEVIRLETKLNSLILEIDKNNKNVELKSTQIKELETQLGESNNKHAQALEDLMSNVGETLLGKIDLNKNVITNKALRKVIKQVSSDVIGLKESNKQLTEENTRLVNLQNSNKHMQDENARLKAALNSSTITIDQLKKDIAAQQKNTRSLEDFKVDVLVKLNTQDIKTALKNLDMAVDAYNEDVVELGLKERVVPGIMSVEDQKEMDMLKLGRRNMHRVMDHFLISIAHTNQLDVYLESLGAEDFKDKLQTLAAEKDIQDQKDEYYDGVNYYYGDLSRRNYKIYAEADDYLLGKNEKSRKILAKQAVSVGVSEEEPNRWQSRSLKLPAEIRGYEIGVDESDDESDDDK